MNFIIIYHFYQKQLKLKKIKKLVTNLYDKFEYVIHIKNLKQAVDHKLVLKKVHRVIKVKKKAWLKSYIHMNTKLRLEAKINFEKDFLKLMNNAVLGKTMKNMRKQRYIKLATTEMRRN